MEAEMTDDSIAFAVEAELAELSGILTEPAEHECLRCYLLRMIGEFGCDGTHRWTIRWRDLRAPRVTGLVRRLFGAQIDDMLSGYRVFSRRFVKSFPSFSREFEIETELTVHALELAMPVGHCRDFEFSIMCAVSTHDAARTITLAWTSTSRRLVRST